MFLDERKKSFMGRLAPLKIRTRKNHSDYHCQESLGISIYLKGGGLMIQVPVWEKATLTLEEAAAYSNVGINKIRELSNDKDCQFVLFVGNKRLIKRKQFERYLEQSYSI